MNTKMKNVAMAFIAMFAVTTSFPAMAKNAYNKPATAELKLVGREGNDPKFQLTLNNTTSEEVIVMVKDESGYVLYREKIKGIYLSKTFQLNMAELEGVNLRIEVLGSKSENIMAFEIIDNATVIPSIATK